ncbi:MAG: AI-2E family transporter [Gammaproteobacteria bacterium]|nr:AI-2E family transporter [Gammaproteobacteria bacterium]MBT8149896.1 AI-2E family transporter [Gammaproteobacteria bacterium]NND39093.1 AI-2E family transporter [Pseudomonadales bacterium]NNM10401.1 AI-2E family transporter [Pseudomonadales bacterium]RZV56069.1 MAG: AI-2E family transporter [Pseudomonadales bacterium]
MELKQQTIFSVLAILLLLLLVYWLRIVIAPFAFAALMAYLGDPIADKLENYGLSRTLSVSLVFILMTLVMIAFILLLVPMIAAQIDLFRQEFPGYIAWFRDTLLPSIHALAGVDENSALVGKFKLALNQNWEKASDLLVTLLAKVTQSGIAIVAWLGSVALIPVVTFYLMRDWDKLIEHIRDLLPRRSVDTVSRLASECDEVLGAFLRGQLLIMICLGIIYTVGLFAIGLDLALLVGMLAGTASIVPYLGAAIGIIAASIAAIVQFQDWIYLLAVAAVFSFGQLVESLFLTPVLVGDKIGLHPVAVIFAVLAGGQLFGFLGVLLALPVAAVTMVLLRHGHHSYTQSVFYDN